MSQHTQPTPDTADKGAPAGHDVGRRRTFAAYATLAIGVLLVIAVVAFIAQNLQTVHLDFFALHGEFPLAVGLMFSALCGALAVLIPGSVRIIQLRRTTRRHRRP